MCNFLFLDDEELKDEDEEKKIVESYYDFDRLFFSGSTLCWICPLLLRVILGLSS
jgi:hypothetical protein